MDLLFELLAQELGLAIAVDKEEFAKLDSSILKKNVTISMDNGLVINKEGSANFGCFHLEEDQDCEGKEDQVSALKLNSSFKMQDGDIIAPCQSAEIPEINHGVVG